jgi:hypothetical protein
MMKRPRQNVIDKHLAVVIEDRGETVTPAELASVQGGVGFAPMYGAPRPKDFWKKLLRRWKR